MCIQGCLKAKAKSALVVFGQMTFYATFNTLLSSWKTLSSKMTRGGTRTLFLSVLDLAIELQNVSVSLN